MLLNNFRTPMKMMADVPAAPAGGAPAPEAAPQSDILFEAPAVPLTAQDPAIVPEAPPSVVIPENWKDALPKELRDEAILGNIKTVDALAKSLIHSQKMVGADKIVVPGKNSTPEEWRGAFEKMGLPKTIEEYKLTKPAIVDEEYFSGVKKAAFDAGILPSQANTLFMYLEQQEKISEQKALTTQTNVQRENVNKLRGELGEAFNETVAKAKAGMKEYFAPEDAERFRAMGLGADPAFVKAMAKIGGLLSEDHIKAQGGTGQQIRTPQEAQARITELKSDIKGPYFNANHPDHAATKKEVAFLFTQAFPSKK